MAPMSWPAVSVSATHLSYLDRVFQPSLFHLLSVSYYTTPWSQILRSTAPEQGLSMPARLVTNSSVAARPMMLAKKDAHWGTYEVFRLIRHLPVMGFCSPIPTAARTPNSTHALKHRSGDVANQLLALKMDALMEI